ncbi:MAG: hypothetical protein WED04_07495 [Promethearchaeati archaeon SRVP18_Atabeyarchaeia-1]
MTGSETSVLVKSRAFSETLLLWHVRNTSSFPWRGTRNSYEILIAEMLLRKTSRNQVREIFPKFIKSFPNVASLAGASTSDIVEIIKPLGIEHKRALLLKKLADSIVSGHGGTIPLKKEELLKLPGVGMYATNAVLCFSAGEDVPLVDTNAIRVVQRVFSPRARKKRARTDPEFWNFVSGLIMPGKGRDFNLALLDFAAAVCKPKNPKCRECPNNEICDYYAGTTMKIENK